MKLPDGRAFGSLRDIQAHVLSSNRLKGFRPYRSNGCSLKKGLPGIAFFVLESERLNTFFERFVDENAVEGGWGAEVDFNPGLRSACIGSPTGTVIVIDGHVAGIV